jgi:hypothetical protein
LSVHSTQLNAPPRPLGARDATTVEVFSSGPPQRSHVDVALIVAEGDALFTLQRYVSEIRDHAAALGCDAVVFDSAALVKGTTSMKATCIAYGDPPPVSRR